MSWAQGHHVVERTKPGMCRGQHKKWVSWNAVVGSVVECEITHVVDNIVEGVVRCVINGVVGNIVGRIVDTHVIGPTMSWRPVVGCIVGYVVGNIVRVCRGLHRESVSWVAS